MAAAAKLSQEGKEVAAAVAVAVEVAEAEVKMQDVKAEEGVEVEVAEEIQPHQYLVVLTRVLVIMMHLLHIMMVHVPMHQLTYIIHKI